MAKTIRQTVYFDAPPHVVFEALMDTRKHATFTGSKARISRKVGGPISAWDGYISGKNLKVEPDKVIVQAWRTVEFNEGEPDSKVMFHLSKKGKGTRLIFVHSNVPDRLADELSQGWHDSYWDPLKAYLQRTTA